MTMTTSGLNSFIDTKISSTAIEHSHNDIFASLNLSHSNKNFLILVFLVFLLVLFIKIKPLLWWINKKVSGKNLSSEAYNDYTTKLSTLNIILSVLLPINMIISIFIIGQIAIMISGEPGNVISNSHLFDPTEPVDEEKQKLLKAKNEARMSEISEILDSFPQPGRFESYLYCQNYATSEFETYYLSCEKSKNLCSKINSISDIEVGEKNFERLRDYKDHCKQDLRNWHKARANTSEHDLRFKAFSQTGDRHGAIKIRPNTYERLDVLIAELNN